MKRSELKVGDRVMQVHAYGADEVVVVSTRPWRNSSSKYSIRQSFHRTESGNGVAVAAPMKWNGVQHWHPKVVQLRQLRTLEQFEAEQARKRAAQTEHEIRSRAAAQATAELAARVAELTGVNYGVTAQYDRGQRTGSYVVSGSVLRKLVELAEQTA